MARGFGAGQWQTLGVIGTGMVETELRGAASKLFVVDGRMRLRRHLMLGCLGLLFLMAATGLSPLDGIDLVSRTWGGAPIHPKSVATLDGGGLFRPFTRSAWLEGGEQASDEGQTPAMGLPNVIGVSACQSNGRTLGHMTSSGASRGACACSLERVQAFSGRGSLGSVCTTSCGGITTQKSHQALSKALVAPYIPGWLEELGVEQYRLEPWGMDGELYRFWCRVPLGASVAGSRYFQSIGGNSGEAIARVLAEIEAWRRGG